MLERLAVAAEPLARLGFDATTMDDIAHATGIPRATLYYHFSGKEEVVAALLRVFLHDLGRAVDRAAAIRAPAALRVRKVIDAQLGVLARHPDLACVLLADLGRVARLPELSADLERVFYEPVERLLQEGTRSGELCVEDPETAARALAGAVMIPGVHYLIRDGRIPRRRVRAQVGRMLLDAFAARPGAREPRSRVVSPP